MTERVFIMGAYEHPGRKLPDKGIVQLHSEVARGALADAGLGLADVDAYLTTPDAPGLGVLDMASHLGLRGLRFSDTTESGGSAYVAHVGHAAMAISAGLCSVALITMAGKSRTGTPRMPSGYLDAPERGFEEPFGTGIIPEYALAARRHMHEFGTTSDQLAEVKVAASLYASNNPHAVVREPVTVEEVLESPVIASPLRRLDCCINTDGGGALVVVSESVARQLARPTVEVVGHGSAVQASFGGALDLTRTAAEGSGMRAREMAGVTANEIDYLGVYDSFTITVLLQLEDLGFCEKGKGGPFVASGALRIGGELPTNTDGGGLCNNHPGGRGGMPKLVEAVRQLRGEATRAVQVPDCEVAMVSGMGGSIGTRAAAATVVLRAGDL